MKYIAEAKDDATLTRLLMEEKALIANATDRSTFLVKQLEQLREKLDTDVKEVKKLMGARLVEIGKLREPLRDDEFLVVSDEDQIFKEIKDPPDCACPACLIRRILK